MFPPDQSLLPLCQFWRSQRRNGNKTNRLGFIGFKFNSRNYGFGSRSSQSNFRIKNSIYPFFDGFRSSHEVNKIEQLSLEDLKSMIDDKLVREHRKELFHPITRLFAEQRKIPMFISKAEKQLINIMMFVQMRFKALWTNLQN